MVTRKACLVSNPCTGRYLTRRTPDLEKICRYLQTQALEVELNVTRGPGDAARIARDAAADGYEEIIISGGDGTINEALQALVGTNLRLGILPTGTGNVLARELNLPLNPMRAAEVIARGNTRSIYPACAIDDRTGVQRYFVLMAGIGLDATVIQRVHPGLKKRIGKAAFWYSGLRHMTGWQPIPFEVKIDGKTYEATFAVVGKAAGYGGQLAVTPRARIDHPEFEVCLIQSRSRLRYLRLLSQAMRGGISASKEDVLFFQTNRVQAGGNAAVQIDGELLGKLPMRFEIAPNTIEVFA